MRDHDVSTLPPKGSAAKVRLHDYDKATWPGCSSRTRTPLQDHEQAPWHLRRSTSIMQVQYRHGDYQPRPGSRTKKWIPSYNEAPITQQGSSNPTWIHKANQDTQYRREYTFKNSFSTETWLQYDKHGVDPRPRRVSTIIKRLQDPVTG